VDRQFWLRYLETCHKHGSLFGVTWSQLQRQLDGLELQKTYVLNPLAPEFVPNRLRHATLTGAAATSTLCADDYAQHGRPARTPIQPASSYYPPTQQQASQIPATQVCSRPSC